MTHLILAIVLVMSTAALLACLACCLRRTWQTSEVVLIPCVVEPDVVAKIERGELVLYVTATALPPSKPWQPIGTSPTFVVREPRGLQ